MKLQRQAKYQTELNNYISTLNPDAVKFINSKRMINLCNRIIKRNPTSIFQEIIIRDILIDKGILLKSHIIKLFLENRGINFNKRKYEGKRKRMRIKTNKEILSIKY